MNILASSLNHGDILSQGVPGAARVTPVPVVFGAKPVTTANVEPDVAGAEAESVPPAIEEYEARFRQKIDAMAIHPSQARARLSISIAPKLFEKMLADPQREAKTLARIEAGLSVAFAFAPAFVTIRFDADGDFFGTAGGGAHLDKFAGESADAFWWREPPPTLAVPHNPEQTDREKREEEVEERKQMNTLLIQLAVQRREHAEAILQHRRDVAAGLKDYAGGARGVVRPSSLESLA